MMDLNLYYVTEGNQVYKLKDKSFNRFTLAVLQAILQNA